MNLYLTVLLGHQITGPTDVGVTTETYLSAHDSGAAALGEALIHFTQKHPNMTLMSPQVPTSLPLADIKALVAKCDPPKEFDHVAGD